MSHYDEETGLVLSDENEIAQEAGLDTKQEDPGPDTPTPDTDDDSESVSEKVKLPRVNKKHILLVIGALASVVMIASMVRPEKKKKSTASDDSVAAELNVPDFSSRPVYEAPDETPEPVAEVQPVYLEKPAPAQPEKQVVRTPVAASSPVVDEGALKARNAPIIPAVQGRLLGQEMTQQAYSASGGQRSSNPYENALATLVQGQDAYTANRLAALGGGTGLGSAPAAAGNSSSGTSYQEQNMQGNKQGFYNSGRDDTSSGSFIGEDTIWNGSMIPGVLITGINTDLPGDIQARVTENIYDSLSGKKLLIPQGSILIASYNSSVSFAQSRVQIAWNTLIRPDGYQLSLGNMNGVDAQGYSGTKGKVDEHLFQYVKAAGIISAFTILNGEFANSIASSTNPSVQNLIAANQGVVNQLSANVIDRTLNIQPTLPVKSGTKINIMLNKNIRLPPIADYPVQSAYKRK